MRTPLPAAVFVALAMVCLARSPADGREAAERPAAPTSRPAGGADEDGFRPMFDGRTLDGWKTPDPAGMAFWRVEDGAITGEVTADHSPKENVFIVWQGDSAGPTAGDFEVRFRFRIFGKEANSGMQFRSEVKDHGLVHGYQADMSGDGRLVGQVYDEYGPRRSLADRGQRVRFAADGAKSVESVGDPFADGKLPDVTQWTDYAVRAEGDHVTVTVNGHVTAELFDADAARRRPAGVFAMPVIPRPMKVQYKDLRLKRLKPADAAATRPAKVDVGRHE